MKKVIKWLAIVLAVLLGVGTILGLTFGFNRTKDKTAPTADKDNTNDNTVPDVKDGETPYIGENGNWFIGDTDTGVKAQGKDGADGTAPHIGENGNWFIGDTDTGVKAQGDDGKDGADGKDGETPYIGADGNWYIGETNLGVKSTEYVYVESEPENIITENYETTFDKWYKNGGCLFAHTPDKLNIVSAENNDGRAYAWGSENLNTKVYRNTLFYGLKIETATEISFETDKAMTLYLWLDKVPEGGVPVSFYSSLLRIVVDTYTEYAEKVADDERGYTLSLRLSKGKHTIRKGESCVLSYLSLTV